MASTRRENNSLGRGHSPSPSKPQKAATKQQPATDHRAKPSSSSSDRQAPSYLKATHSSRTDGTTTKYVKKTPAATDDQNLVRRRSFDKPPSPSHLQKALASSPPSRAAGLRSATFSARSSSVTAKLTPKPSQQSQPFASSRNGSGNKKSLTPSNSRRESAPKKSHVKKETRRPAAADDETEEITVEKHDNVEQTTDLGHDHDDDETKLKSESEEDVPRVVAVAESEEKTKNVDVGEEKLANSGEEDQKEEEEDEEKDGHHHNHESSELDSSVSEEPITPVLETEEAHGQNKFINEDGENLPNNEEAKEEEGSNDNSVLEAEEKLPEADEKEKGQERQNIVDSDNEAVNEERTVEVAAEEENKVETKEEGDKEKKLEGEGSEEPKAEAVAQERKAEPANETPKRAGQVYNDVIEETKKKLMETSRKNRVKALAGAFQSVIDYESASK